MTTTAILLAIVEVDRDDRIICQAPGCGRSVYKQIHVVRDGTTLRVLGSACFKALYGGADHSSSTPFYGGGFGRHLTEEEREMLKDNTARFIAHLERLRLSDEHHAQLERSSTVSKPGLSLQNANPATSVVPPSPTRNQNVPVDPRFDGRAAMRWIWSRSLVEARRRIAIYQDGPDRSALTDLAVRYALDPARSSDPWMMSVIIERKHRAPPVFLFRKWLELDLIEKI